MRNRKDSGAFRRFSRNESGQFAYIFALLSLPLLTGVGVAIDYTNISRVKADLQNANDSAALFAARYYEENGKLPGEKDLERFLVSNFDGVSFGKPTVSMVGDEIVVDSGYQVATSFLSIFGQSNFNGAVQSAVTMGSDKNIEVALVLDTTGSMGEDGKLDDLKDAAKSFVNTVMAVTTAKTSAKIAMVPFSDYVNVGLDKRSASWLEVEPDSSKTSTVNECRTVYNASQYEHYTCTWNNDGKSESGTCSRLKAGAVGTQECKDWTDTTGSNWYGCVGSREYPNNLRDGNYVTEKVQGVHWDICPSPITPLSDDKTALISGIDAFTAKRETYLPIGISWGVRVLSPGEPYGESAGPASDDLSKIMVLMTDGQNTVSKWPNSKWHNDSSPDIAEADDWTEEACQIAKDGGITVYTVTFGTGLSGQIKNMMKDCASTADHYFHADDGTKLSKAFNAIAAELRVSYLSR